MLLQCKYDMIHMYITHESYIYSLMFVDYYVTLHVEITYFQDLPLIRFPILEEHIAMYQDHHCYLLCIHV